MYSVSSHSSFGIFDCHLKKADLRNTDRYKQQYSVKNFLSSTPSTMSTGKQNVSPVHKHICEEEQNDDPGIIVVFNDAIEIHQVLQLPSVANIRPILQPGPNAAQSKLNLIHWMDDLVILSANGGHCLVHTTNGKLVFTRSWEMLNTLRFKAN